MPDRRQQSGGALCPALLQTRLEADLASRDQQCSDLQRQLAGRREADRASAGRLQQLQAHAVVRRVDTDPLCLRDQELVHGADLEPPPALQSAVCGRPSGMDLPPLRIIYLKPHTRDKNR